MKTLEEIRKTETGKLLEELKQLEKELYAKKFDVVNNQAKDAHNIRLLKLEVARIKTVLTEQK